jgi:hypothetical protein
MAPIAGRERSCWACSLLHPYRNLTGIFEVEARLQCPEAGPTVLVQTDHLAINDAGSRHAVLPRSSYVGKLEGLRCAIPSVDVD